MLSAAVVEIVPALVVEMVPALVVEMVPARAEEDMATANNEAQRIDLKFFIVSSPGEIERLWWESLERT